MATGPNTSEPFYKVNKMEPATAYPRLNATSYFQSSDASPFCPPGPVSPLPFPLHRSTLLQTVHRCALLPPFPLSPRLSLSSRLLLAPPSCQLTEEKCNSASEADACSRVSSSLSVEIRDRPLDQPMYVGRRHLPPVPSRAIDRFILSNERINIDDFYQPPSDVRTVSLPPPDNLQIIRILGVRLPASELITRAKLAASFTRQLRIKFRDIRRKPDTLSTIHDRQIDTRIPIIPGSQHARI
mgnify:CR=1 FL=1